MEWYAWGALSDHTGERVRRAHTVHSSRLMMQMIENKQFSALPGVEYFRSGTAFSIGDLNICPFTIPHATTIEG